MGSSPIPTPTPSSPTYVPSFPFYDAEPYWPKGGYGHHGGGDDSGGAAATTDFYIINNDISTLPIFGVVRDIDLDNESLPICEKLESELMTTEGGENCIHYKNCPVGAWIVKVDDLDGSFIGYVVPSLNYVPTITSYSNSSNNGHQFCPRPIDGLYIVGCLGEYPK